MFIPIVCFCALKKIDTSFSFFLHPFPFLTTYLLENLGHLTCRVSHSLGFSDYPFQHSSTCCWLVCISHKLAAGSRGLIRLRFDPFDDGGAFFHQKVDNVW